MNCEPYKYDETKLVRLEKMREFSINVKNVNGLRLYLREGTAEIFGRELPQQTIQHFPKGERFTIFTWTGCILWLDYNNPEDFFALSDESMYPIYANINQYLSELRTSALEKRKLGPRVLICGSNQSGKTTVAKTLINYGCKQGWTPVLVDLDPLKNAVMAGGCIGACVCKHFYPSNGIEINNKIVLFHGYNRPQIGLLKNQVEVLGQSITKKLSADLDSFNAKYPQQSDLATRDRHGSMTNSMGASIHHSHHNQHHPSSNLNMSSAAAQQHLMQQQVALTEKRLFASGCVINMPPMQSAEQKEMIDFIVKHFNVDVVVGLDDDIFNSIRSNLLLTNGYSIIRASKPCGLKNREEKEQTDEARNANSKIFDNYFKGVADDIQCHKQEFQLNSLLVYRLKLADKVSSLGVSSALAGNALQQLKKPYYERVDLMKEQVGKSIVAVLNLPRAALDKLKDEEIFEKISKSTLGLLFQIWKIQTNLSSATLFLPGISMESIVTSNVCLIGEITWIESSNDKKGTLMNE